VNDSSSSVRFAAIRALGEIRDEQAIQAITDQLKYYEKGDGALAALEALARIAHPSSVPMFLARIEDPDPRLRRAAIEGLARAGDKESVSKLVFSVNQDDSDIVRAAMAYALHRQGYPNYLARLVDMMYYPEPARQIQGYLLEVGGTIVPGVLPRLKDPDPGVRERLAIVLGAIGDQSTAVALTPLKQDSAPQVASAATHAIERIKMTQK
jgi:HEAT repeat protein